MPNAVDVRSVKWSGITVLFDDGEYSVISGLYENNRCLGERWNGDAETPRGFPNVFGNPVWHVAPSFLEMPILHELLNELSRANPTPQNVDAYRANILDALRQRTPQR